MIDTHNRCIVREGTGLSLQLSHQLAALLNARIVLISELGWG
jgi:signal transduction histidine kinase